MVLPPARGHSRDHTTRVMVCATREAPAQARIRSGLAVPITGAMPAGCFISHPSSTASRVVSRSRAMSESSCAVADSASVGRSGGLPV